jgi:hypothetical protein
VSRLALGVCGLLLLPVLFIGAGIGVLGGGASASLGQAAPVQVAGIPSEYLALFHAAGARFAIPWAVLAAIGKVCVLASGCRPLGRRGSPLLLV